MAITRTIHSIWKHLPGWLRGSKAAHLYAAIGLLLAGSLGAVAQNSFTKTSFVKPTGTITVAPSSSGSTKTYNPMGTAANDPNSQDETNSPTPAPANSHNSTSTSGDFSVSVNPPAYTLSTTDAQTPFFLASTSNGTTVNWKITGDSSVVPSEGATASGATAQFNLKLASDATLGRHVVTITGTGADGTSHYTTMAITVTQGATFTMSDSGSPQYTPGATTATIAFSFEVTANGDTDVSSIQTSASVITPGSGNVKVSGTGSQRKAIVTLPASYTGQVNVQISGTDGTYSPQPLALSYTVTGTGPTQSP